MLSLNRVQDETNDVRMPYTTDDVTFKKISSLMMQMTTTDGSISLRWDGNFRIYIQIDPMLKSRVSFWYKHNNDLDRG